MAFQIEDVDDPFPDCLAFENLFDTQLGDALGRSAMLALHHPFKLVGANFHGCKLRAGGRRGLQARRPSAAPQWPIHSGRSVRTDDAFAARGMVSRRRSSQMATRRHNAGSKCEANSRLISKGRQ